MPRILCGLLMLATAASEGPVAGPSHGSAGTLNDIAWEAAGANGTRYALLEGDRARAGQPFSYAFFIPAGVWDGAHSHSAAARVFVAKGALSLGYGKVADRTRARRYPAGSYVVVPAGAVHFDGSDVDTVIIGTALGPWSTTYLDGTAPASAGTPITPPHRDR